MNLNHFYAQRLGLNIYVCLDGFSGKPGTQGVVKVIETEDYNAFELTFKLMNDYINSDFSNKNKLFFESLKDRIDKDIYKEIEASDFKPEVNILKCFTSDYSYQEKEFMTRILLNGEVIYKDVFNPCEEEEFLRELDPYDIFKWMPM